MESILTSVKKMLGIEDEYEHFDADLIMHINSVIAILTQLGVGPPGGFVVEDKTTYWSDFIPDDPQLESVKSYVYLKVRMLFDPPLSTAVSEAMDHMISELEWRICVAADRPEGEQRGGKGHGHERRTAAPRHPRAKVGRSKIPE